MTRTGKIAAMLAAAMLSAATAMPAQAAPLDNAEKLRKLDVLIDTDELQINPSKNTMNNSYDIILVNEDYTLGKVLEFMLYSKFYEGAKTLTYCGFKKMHPHDNDSIVRIAFHDATDKEGIKIGLKACIGDAVAVFKKIAESFK
jgi:DNA-directed RNA polymerase subunit L